jgi:hypothetical protein
MRKFLSSLVIGVFLGVTLLPIEASIAADTPSSVVGFEIIAPTTAKANEAIDVTVRAIDTNKKTVTSYRGSVIFISDTFGDTVPSPGKSITFTAEDAGQKKFSKGVVFRSTGKQKIYVADVDHSSDIIGETTVTVESAGNAGTDTSGETVTIVTPVKDSSVTSDMVAVSGKSKKNSKVSFVLNGKDMGTAITDESGLFTKTLSGATQDKNLLQVNLLDGANAIVAKSEEIIFSRATSSAGFYNIVITPSTTVDISTPMTILVEGDPGMASASVGLDGSLITLTENQPGKYSTQTSAPSKSGSYLLSVSLVNALGTTIDKKDVATLTVNEPVKPVLIPRFTDIKTVADGAKITLSFAVTDAPADLDKFKIAYGVDADSLSQEVMTYSTGKIQGTGGVYSWYIDKLDPKTYTFKIFGARADNSLIPLFSSEPIIATINKGDVVVAANVETITVKTEAGKSIMSWTPVACAVSYNVYKVTAAWDYTLVQNTKEPSYTIHIDSGSTMVSDFAVKAICADGVESADFTQVAKVQTGPAATAILIILAGILSAVILRKKSLS